MKWFPRNSFHLTLLFKGYTFSLWDNNHFSSYGGREEIEKNERNLFHFGEIMTFIFLLHCHNFPFTPLTPKLLYTRSKKKEGKKSLSFLEEEKKNDLWFLLHFLAHKISMSLCCCCLRMALRMFGERKKKIFRSFPFSLLSFLSAFSFLFSFFFLFFWRVQKINHNYRFSKSDKLLFTLCLLDTTERKRKYIWNWYSFI